MESKNDINELIFKTEVDSEIKKKLVVAKRKKRRRDKSGAWD